MAYVGERHGHETCLLGAYSLVRKYNKGMTDTVKSLLTAIPRLAFFFFFLHNSTVWQTLSQTL